MPKPGERHRYNWSAPILPSKHDGEDDLHGRELPVQGVPIAATRWDDHQPRSHAGIDRNKLPMRGRPCPTRRTRRHDQGPPISATSAPSTNRRSGAGLLVVGTDDGLIQVTRDGGKHLDEDRTVSRRARHDVRESRGLVEANEGTIYATLDGHRSNDFKPYVLKSTDYGKTWTSIASAIFPTADRCR